MIFKTLKYGFIEISYYAIIKVSEHTSNFVSQNTANVPLSFTHLPYSDTGYFSNLVTDYLKGTEELQQFYTYAPDAQGIEQAIADRAKYSVNRQLLVELLRKQYSALPASDAVNKNMELLLRDNTFTICTAHQPNLMTGYLYFIYKIVHTIKLAEELNGKHPDKQFVPVYYMGSEDNDLDELGTFRYEGKKFVWEADGQTGAVGRMSTASLKPLLDELFKLLGPPGDNLKELKTILKEAYLQHQDISSATQYLVHQLFGRYGLIVLNPDEDEFKRCILHILKDDLLIHSALPLATDAINRLSIHYKAQAHPRQINLFYLKDNIRERIERQGDVWTVVNTDITWTEQELLAELEAHPGRFSPNVILRGLFQESIMPNVVFIGGGAEVAYWLQLKDIFNHFDVFFPAILLRQSAMWIDAKAAKLRKELGLSIAELFRKEPDLVKDYILANSSDEWQTNGEAIIMEQAIARLKEKAEALDPTLRSSADAVLTKIKYQLQVLEKKMYRAEKRKMQVQLARIAKLRALIFPNGSLQERYDNFLPYFLQHGHEYTDFIKEGTSAMNTGFLVIEEPA